MTLAQHLPFDADLVDVTLPYWWHPEVPEGWLLPESGDFPHGRDKAEGKALIEEEVDGVC